MVAPRLADRIGWRRRKKSDGPWEAFVTLASCTPGQLWEEMQKKFFLSCAPDHELNAEWDFAMTLAGEKPSESVKPPQLPLSQEYRDRMMRPNKRR